MFKKIHIKYRRTFFCVNGFFAKSCANFLTIDKVVKIHDTYIKEIAKKKIRTRRYRDKTDHTKTGA